MTNGLDKAKPAIGMCIKYTSEHGKALVMEHNKIFSYGKQLLPHE